MQTKNTSRSKDSTRYCLESKKFLDHKYDELLQEIIEEEKHGQDLPVFGKSASKLSTKKAVAFLVAQEKPGKALSRLTSSGVAPHNARSTRIMKLKHPQEEEELQFERGEYQTVQFLPSMVRLMRWKFWDSSSSSLVLY